MFSSDSSMFKAAASIAALALTASTAAVPTDNNLWKVPHVREEGSKKIAWKQLPASVARVDAASAEGRTFSHYPSLHNIGGTLYLLFSASGNDVDGMGQDVRIATSGDAGKTWTKPQVAFPPALLPGQRVENSKYWCDRGIPQRALRPLTVVILPSASEGSIQAFAVAQSSDNVCPGSFQSAGRVARQLNVDGSGSFKGDPCWIETNDYTGAHEWAETVYGTQYRMKVCDNKDAINAALNKPENVGPLATQLFNSPIIAADGKHNVSYPTKAVWHNEGNGGYWQRFWSDVSVRNMTGSAFVEYSTDKDGKNWYPGTTSGKEIRETNIHQVAGKADYGAFQSATPLSYYISNAALDGPGKQALLTIATARGAEKEFYNIGIVRGGDAGAQVYAGTRPEVNSGLPGFYWPSAAMVGDKLAISYSENRQVIWVSVLQMSALP